MSEKFSELDAMEHADSHCTTQLERDMALSLFRYGFKSAVEGKACTNEDPHWVKGYNTGLVAIVSAQEIYRAILEGKAV